MRSVRHIRWPLVIYDVILFIGVGLAFMFINPSNEKEFSFQKILIQLATGVACLVVARMLCDIYKQIWRYGNMQSYLRLIIADSAATVIYYFIQRFLFPAGFRIEFIRLFGMMAMDLIAAMAIRFVYRYAYQYCDAPTKRGRFLSVLLNIFGCKVNKNENSGGTSPARKIKIAIIGAGRVGVSLAEELINNPNVSYVPVCFVDTNKEKVGRIIYDIPVLSEEDTNSAAFANYGVQEIVFALPQLPSDEKKRLYDLYKQTGCKIKAYDYPMMQSAGTGRRSLREFEAEELLFRTPVDLHDDKTYAYYRGKTVMITGGGGSIGSELCRQIAKMSPRRIVVLDVYENGAYDIQQELKIAYGNTLDVAVEIASVRDVPQIDRIFDLHRPQIVLHAAAHKHVPLMEHNCCEAIKNNVFGTLNVLDVAEKHGCERFIMISTDKAVNPTNIMGATKRMCEMLVLSRSRKSGMVVSCTRFGNVLGSAGSVIPLFKRQIANGGPVTLTDKRIIRYFMTIPEASQLVLQSGQMAKNGELFVLDMGKPIKILELAENMIRLSGYEPYRDIDIIETGLRPGEKLYEELLIKSEDLDKTVNSLIFIEREKPLSPEEISDKLRVLAAAIAYDDDECAKQALMTVVPTYRRPEETNAKAEQSAEMRDVR